MVWIILCQINQICHKMGHKCSFIWGDWLWEGHMIANHPIYEHNYSYHISGDRSPLRFAINGFQIKQIWAIFKHFNQKYNKSIFKVGDSGFVPRSGVQVSKKQSVFSPLTRKYQHCGEPLWRRGNVIGLKSPGLELRIVSGGQRHLTHITILRGISWYSLAYYVHKAGLKSHSIFFSLPWLGYLS